MDKKSIKAYLPWRLCAGIFIIAAASGLFYEVNNHLSDVLYRERRGIDGRITIVGIDQRFLEALGPFGIWDRRVLAQAVSYLNQGDIHPAAIGLDIPLAGEIGTEGDSLLAEAAGTGESVVTAAAGTFSSSLVTAADGAFYLDGFTVKSSDEPCKALRDVTAQGHINAMYDKDSVLRHQLLELELPDGHVFPSFALTIARKYIQREGGREASLPPVDSRGFWYLNYSGLPEDYSELISIVDLLEENVPPECFADRIVLIGPYAVGLGDQYITSADRGNPMCGVKIQANVIHTLLEDDYKEGPSAGIQLAVLFLVLAAAGAWFRSSRLARGGAVWLAGSLAYITIAKAAYEKGMVLRTLWIPLGLTPFFGVLVIIRYGEIVLEEQRVTATFKHYAAPKIVDEILRQGTQSLELGEKLTQLAMLFVDIRGLTSMSEALEPGQVVEVLSNYLTLVSSSTKNHGGTLDKLIGGAAMAFWGAPLAQEDYIVRAVLAALSMAKEADRLGDQLEARFGCRLTFGTGVYTDPAVVGNVGAPDRMDYTAIGNTVNTASKLKSNAPKGKAYISAAVTDALEGRVNAKVVGNIRLKGKAGEFQMLELEGLTERSSGRMSVSEGKEAG